MSEPAKRGTVQERTKSARQIFDQARGIASRVYDRSTREQLMNIADRYAANIREYLGENYNINTPVPRSVYARNNNRS